MTGTTTPAPPRRKRRVFWPIFAAMQALFALWAVITAAFGGATLHDQAVAWCHAHPLNTSGTFAQCVADYGGGKAGVALGVGAVITVWAVADIIVGGTYAIWRLARRPR